MNKFIVRWTACVALVACAFLQLARAAEDAEELVITKIGGAIKRVPVTLEGFSGEALDVIRFDLEAQGFEVVSTGAQYNLSGSNAASLIGRANDALTKASILSKEYTGGGTRMQGHAFVDDFIATFPGRSGISRRKITFRVDSGKASEIYVADYDGAGAVKVTQDGSIARDPAWVPGRRTLLYMSYKSGTPAIYSHDLSTGLRRPVSNRPGLNAAPAVSADGNRLAMILSEKGSPDLYVSALDGSGAKQLTFTKEDESSPCWSPDGRTICVVSRAGGKAALYAVPASGGAMKRISTVGAINVTEPTWSPDGKTIAFTANMGGFQICTVPAAGGSVTVLAAGEDPVWGPNSRTILFTKRQGGRRILSLLDVPTKHVKDVRQVSGSSSQPDWAR